MRTLYEIIEAAKDGDKPTHDECYFAMLALDSLSTFTTRELRDAAFNERRGLPLKFRAEEDFKRWKRALNTSPDEWLGPQNHPGHPNQVEMRRMAKKVMREAQRRVEERDAASGEKGSAS